MSIIQTHDGNWLAHDPTVGTVSGASRDEVIREIERRRLAKARTAVPGQAA